MAIATEPRLGQDARVGVLFAAPAYAGPTGERADWKWYEPFAPRVPRSDN